MTEVLTLVFDAFISLLLVLTITYCWVLNRRIRVLQDSRSELARLIRHFDESTEKASASIVALQSASKKIGEVIQERVEKANFMADDLAFLIEKASKSADQIEKNLAEYRDQRKQAADDVAMTGVRRPAARSLHQAAAQVSRAPSQEFAPASRGGVVPRPAEPVVPPQPQRAQASATANETLSVIQQRTAKATEAVANENEAPVSENASARARTNATLEALLQRMADRQDEETAVAEPVEENAAPASAATRLMPNKKRTAEPKLESADADRPRSRAEQELLDIIKAGSRV